MPNILIIKIYNSVIENKINISVNENSSRYIGNGLSVLCIKIIYYLKMKQLEKIITSTKTWVRRKYVPLTILEILVTTG